jgi:hypothetical protein
MAGRPLFWGAAVAVAVVSALIALGSVSDDNVVQWVQTVRSAARPLYDVVGLSVEDGVAADGACQLPARLQHDT